MRNAVLETGDGGKRGDDVTHGAQPDDENAGTGHFSRADLGGGEVP